MIKDNEKISRDIEKALQNKKFIVTGNKVYQPHYSINAGGYYASKVYTAKGNLTRVGRYYHMTGEQVNHLLGFNLVHNL